MEVSTIEYKHYGKCKKITNGTIELLITEEIGPRIICYKTINGCNVFEELDLEKGADTQWGRWHLYGGHRLWHSPEENPRSYEIDDYPVSVEPLGSNGLRVIQKVEPHTHIQKEMNVILDENGTGVSVIHKLTNKGIWPVELAPWALSVMATGGTAIFPNEPYIPSSECLLPARAMVLWTYTNLSDPRWKFGSKYIKLKCDADHDNPQKFGLMDKQGWAAYLNGSNLFVNRFGYIDGANYPDYGCNCESYTSGSFMEVESVGTLATLKQNETHTHTERWFIFENVNAGDTEESLDAAIKPLVESTK